jgi:micrococcal nuclease
MQRKTVILILVALTMTVSEKIAPIGHAPVVNNAPLITDVRHPTLTADRDPRFSPVIRVVDGDTIVVEIHGTQEKIRLIGVDTPENVDPRKPAQCFGEEASAFTKTLLESKKVRFESDPRQGDRDKYGRLLRYVFLPDGTFVNKAIIAEGYGHEYTYRTPYQHQGDFKADERSARESLKGLWSPTACSTKP